ncbi:SWIM zinc finger domain-containing protein [Saccharopolyspora indica]|uniref:SWIM zinc finger family protein n=1 Tax=Saccharopolyspora indica TaxID=1229659 RepID=UPI0022EA629C|nr:SWIM zinc finger family protein [Saccharopolyspora indica]MDA3647360.1 SWIM zinc finger domain-containing protein [Saccharopolyspora indica]
MSDVQQVLAYRRPSALADRHLGLETAGGTGQSANPRFFTGFLTEAAPAASGLLAVARVARSQYPDAAGRAAFRDPVVTCDGGRLRFESFSRCGGVYARLDVLSAGLDGEVHDRGTTNVDVNEPLRRMLAKVGGRDPLHLSVGPDELTATALGGSVLEKKVPLPQRWLRGFAEVQVITAGFEPRAELSAADAARLLKSLPSGSRRALWAVPAGRSLRLTGSPVPGAVCIAGPERLESLVPLLRFAKALRVYGPRPDNRPTASAWELDLPGMRLVLALSPGSDRGFSGEGAVLDALASDDAEADAELIGALLAFEPRVETDLLAERSGLPQARVRDALIQLGTAGRIGYDLAEAAHFHRELPYDAKAVDAMNPRLRNARALVEAGAVRIDGDSATVTAGEREHRVRAGGCTCRWWAEFGGTRGKCKHALAVDVARNGVRG